MDFFGDSLISILILILFMSIVTVFFNYGRKVRMKVRKRKLAKQARKILEIDELPLHKNNEINWGVIEQKTKKLPDDRDKYMFLRGVRDQIEFSKIEISKAKNSKNKRKKN